MDYDYNELAKFADKLLGLLEKTSSKEEFMLIWNEEQYNSLAEHISYCFFKVNELAYNYLEKGEIPSMGQCLFGFSISAIAHKLELWDGGKDSPYYSYGQFTKGDLTTEIATTILKNQKTIEKFAEAMFTLWCEVHHRGMYMDFKKVS